MEIASSVAGDFSSPSLLVAAAVTGLCCVLALLAVRLSPRKSGVGESDGSGSGGEAALRKNCGCSCSCNGSIRASDSVPTATPYLNGSAGDMLERAPVVTERQTGASMMEQLVPEITTHALSYLDYPSLCRLSMTNSLMRKAANDDNAWKALYHKDFTLEQDSVRPVNGWKAYYATTRAVVNINSEFFNIIKDRSFAAMTRLWLNADYVKCVHASGELFTGFNAVMESWQMAFSWEQGVEFQIRDVRARVLTDMAWVTMKAYVDMDSGPFNMTNVFEFHNGHWYMVHHHSSVMLVVDGGVGQQMVLG